MGIAYSTFRSWRDKFSAISAVLKKGKEVVDYAVENALLKNALKGDTTAQIYWLKNRRPDKWRDRVELRGDTNTLKKAKELLGGVDSVINGKTN